MYKNVKDKQLSSSVFISSICDIDIVQSFGMFKADKHGAAFFDAPTIPLGSMAQTIFKMCVLVDYLCLVI